MAKQTAFLQRRGDSFSFRIAVPTDLRANFGHREAVRALHTTDKRNAIPIALYLASKAKRLFHDMRSAMSSGDNKELLHLMQERRLTSALEQQGEEHDSGVRRISWTGLCCEPETCSVLNGTA